MPLRIRPITERDLPSLVDFIRELAEYEKLSDLCVATPELLKQCLFGPDAVAEAIVVEADGQLAGYATWFKTFSSFLARPGMWLEDIYVRPAFRKRGLGKAMIVHLAREAHRHGYGRFEWTVLDWNTPAIEFYKSLGATPMDEWTTMRVTGEALAKLAGET